EHDDVARDHAIAALVLELAAQCRRDFAGLGMYAIATRRPREDHAPTERRAHARPFATHWSRCAFTCSSVSASTGARASSGVAPKARKSVSRWPAGFAASSQRTNSSAAP